MQAKTPFLHTHVEKGQCENATQIIYKTGKKLECTLENILPGVIIGEWQGN